MTKKFDEPGGGTSDSVFADFKVNFGGLTDTISITFTSDPGPDSTDAGEMADVTADLFKVFPAGFSVVFDSRDHDVPGVPEPESVWLLATALCLLSAAWMRRRTARE